MYQLAAILLIPIFVSGNSFACSVGEAAHFPNGHGRAHIHLGGASHRDVSRDSHRHAHGQTHHHKHSHDKRHGHGDSGFKGVGVPVDHD